MDTTDDEIIATCLKPEIHKLNEKLTKEHRSQATEAEFLGAFEIAMRNMIKEAKAEGYKEGKADTAKQIFKELDAIAWEQIEPSRLEEFYEQFSNAKEIQHRGMRT